MLPVLTLEELAKQDVAFNNHGLKTKGIVENLIKNNDIKNKNDIGFIVPPGFSVPVEQELSINNQELKEKYFSITKDLETQTIIMARSSDPNEMPGELESHISIYYPEKFDESFANWVSAAKKTRAAGSSAILGQVMVPSIDEKEQVFGTNALSFVYNSSNFVNAGEEILNLSFGLPYDLVLGKGYNIISIIKSKKYGVLTPIHSRLKYSVMCPHGKAESLISKIKFALLNNEGEKGYRELNTGVGNPIRDMNYAVFPFNSRLTAEENEITHRDIFDIMGELKKRIGKDFIAEGMIVDKTKLYLFQLDTYEPISKAIEEITIPKDPKRIIAQYEEFKSRSSGLIISANAFIGDLRISDVHEGNYKNTIVITNNADFSENNLPMALGIPTKIIKKPDYESYTSHNFFNNIQRVNKLAAEYNIPVFSIPKDFVETMKKAHAPSNRKIVDQNSTTFKDIHLEFTDQKAILYLSKYFLKLN